MIQGGDEASIRGERELRSAIQALPIKLSSLYSNISKKNDCAVAHLYSADKTNENRHYNKLYLAYTTLD